MKQVLLKWNYMVWLGRPENIEFSGIPVFSWKDGAKWEKGGLYKACVIWGKRTCGICFYNAKIKKNGNWNKDK